MVFDQPMAIASWPGQRPGLARKEGSKEGRKEGKAAKEAKSPALLRLSGRTLPPREFLTLRHRASILQRTLLATDTTCAPLAPPPPPSPSGAECQEFTYVENWPATILPACLPACLPQSFAVAAAAAALTSFVRPPVNWSVECRMPVARSLARSLFSTMLSSQRGHAAGSAAAASVPTCSRPATGCSSNYVA